MRTITRIIAIYWIFIAGCEEDAPFMFNNPPSFLVVDGMITNTPEDNYIRLSLTDIQAFDTTCEGTVLFRRVPVNNALVIVTDDLGNSETLTVTKVLYELSYDSVLNGTYPIKTLKGIPGRTYTLYIKYQNKEYTAESHMQAVPDIDSLYFDRMYNPVKFEYYYPPLISFCDPQDEKNHYLFRFIIGPFYTIKFSDYQHLYGNNPLMITIISDDFLSSFVNGLDVTKGYSPDYWINGYTRTAPGDSVCIGMYSLSKEGYDFWKAVTDQIESEGGIFNPAPATPPGNISGGALGLFQASGVSYIKGRIPEDIGNK